MGRKQSIFQYIRRDNMKVHIENNLYIESDGMQYILKEYTGKTAENGTPLFKLARRDNNERTE